jgi:hypothetical protein
VRPSFATALACLLALPAPSGCAGRERENERGQASVAVVAPPASAIDEPADAPAVDEPAATPAPPAPAADDSPRVWAKSRFVWIRESPEDDSWVGFLWFGGSVKLAGTRPRPGFDCATYYAVEPRGFVCVDGKRATMDASDPVLQSMLPHAPDLASPWPHRYGESRELQRYPTLPTPEQQRAREWDLAQHQERVARAREGSAVHPQLEGVDLTPSPSKEIALLPLPFTVHEQRKRLRHLSTVAYSAETRAHGRDWLLTADLMWVPKDRVVVYPKITFAGVHLGTQAQLPLAFFRGEDRPRYRRAGDGFELAEGSFARLSFVELTGEEARHAGDAYLETRQPGLWVKKADAVVPVPQKLTPWGAPVGGSDDTGKTPAGRATWLQASIWGGWLLAYEGTLPVFATLIAPGRGGTPVPGTPAIDTAATPTGTFKITGKFATATMAAPHEFIHSDVPWTQNFSGPHALHGAYWHDNWGNRMSAGCVNVSPIDGKWLYEFTEPEVPAGWHGVRWTPSREPATSFVLHK